MCCAVATMLCLPQVCMLLVARHDPAEDNAKAAQALWEQVGARR
jgi:hypothetical protein